MSKKQPRPERPLPVKWEFGPDIPTYDFLEGIKLDNFWGLQEAVGYFIHKMEEGQFLAWEAVAAHEQGLPLTQKQHDALDELLDFTDGEEERVFYINDIPRTNEPWFVILNQIVPRLLIETFRTFDIHEEVQCEGWRNLADCLAEHGDGLSLPQGVSSALEVVPLELRHKLWLQDCFDALSGLGQYEELTLENGEQEYRIGGFRWAFTGTQGHRSILQPHPRLALGAGHPTRKGQTDLREDDAGAVGNEGHNGTDCRLPGPGGTMAAVGE